jgi:hypothetical protein
VPGLLIFAAFGLVMFFHNLVAGKLGPMLSYAALLAVSTVFISWPQRNPSLWALDAYNSGWQALESGNFALAQRKLELARSYVPDNAETNFALGNLKLAQSDAAAATTFYLATLRLDPQHRGLLITSAFLPSRMDSLTWLNNGFARPWRSMRAIRRHIFFWRKL